jgi:ketosteroid isomerase-like protein
VSREDVDTVRRMFEAFARRDLDATLAQLDPDVTLTVPATAGLAGRTGPYRGHEGVRQYLSDVEAVWSELELEPLDFRDAAGAVVIFGRVTGRRAPQAQDEPGETIEDSVIWTWKLRDGRIVSGTAHRHG